MIVIRLRGGLGNQLFQYAFGRRLAIHHGAELVFDLGFLAPANCTPRQYELGHFLIRGRVGVADDDHLAAVQTQCVRAFGRDLSLIVENNAQLDTESRTIPDDVYLVGYWQAYTNFQDIRPELSRELQPIQPLSESFRELSTRLDAPGSIALHVRRGDYVSNASVHEIHGTCEIDYYRRAIDHLQDSGISGELFVFSDDPEWVSKEFCIGQSFTQVAVGNAIDQFNLMRKANHFVIANSTFSWWAAWIASREDKRCVAPKAWFRNSTRSVSRLFPPDWVRV